MKEGADIRVAEKPEELAVKATMTFPSQDGGGLSFETYFGQDEQLARINDLMDKLYWAAKRQAIRRDIEREKTFHYNDGAELDRMKHDMQVMDLLAAERAQAWSDSGRRGDYKANDAEVKSREGLVATMKTLSRRREQHATRIEQLEAELKSLGG